VIKNKIIIALAACLLCIYALTNVGCNKRSFITKGGAFSFSTDTLTFDTVFTTQGSVTQQFLIKNNNDKWIKLNSISLGRGNTSPYRLNVDGIPTQNISNIDIAPFDSVYVFVAVTINPSLVDAPFIEEDSVVVNLNGNSKALPLIAYGQNAVYVNDSVLTGNITWTKNKPIVIVNSALVDSGAILTIEAGTRVYFHQNSKLFVDGTLKAIGTVSDSIVMCGDRLDRNYFGGDIPGEWCGLHFLNNSINNELAYCIIKNGGAPWKRYNTNTKDYDYLTGALIYLQENKVGSTAPKLILNNCFVGLSIQFGILSFNSSLNATNCLFYACGAQNFATLQGGSFSFNHCTFGNYGYKSFLKHDKNSIVAAKNYFDPDPDDITKRIGAPLNMNFTNCIIDGTATDGDEVIIDNDNKWPASILFNHCLIKQKSALPSGVTIDTKTLSLFNAATAFKEPNLNNFTLTNSSAARGAGLVGFVSLDIKDNTRGNPPSIGCWE
jgi:hypothetical protein